MTGELRQRLRSVRGAKCLERLVELRQDPLQRFLDERVVIDNQNIYLSTI